MIKYIVALSFGLLSLKAHAQNPDSVAVATSKWQVKKFAKKTKLFTHQFLDSSLFNANQYLAYIQIKKSRRAPLFSFGYNNRQLIKTSLFGKTYKAIAAINGTFFDIKKGGSVDFLKVKDSVINQNRIEKTRAVHQKAAIVINNGQVSIKKWDQTPNWENNLTDQNIMVSGPLLRINNQAEMLDSVAFNKLRHPRTALGIKKDGSTIMLIVDGRNQNSSGMSLFELEKVMRWLGCVSAINLDGGGSTTLWIENYSQNGVVNHPSDNKKWDNEGERNVANVIFIKSKDK